MTIDSHFSHDLKRAAQAFRARKQLSSIYETDEIKFHAQQSLLRKVIESCPAFLCGDVVVIHQNGTITWGHDANIFDMRRETAVRGILFLFNDIQNTTAACLQMDAGHINTSLYHDMDLGDFIQFLRDRILPVAFSWYKSNYGHTASSDTTPLYIADENFNILEFDTP